MCANVSGSGVVSPRDRLAIGLANTALGTRAGVGDCTSSELKCAGRVLRQRPHAHGRRLREVLRGGSKAPGYHDGGQHKQRLSSKPLLAYAFRVDR